MVLSDRIVVMHQGRIRQVDNPVEIYRRPADKFVADFIGRANFLPVTVADSSASHMAVKIQDVALTAPKSKLHDFQAGDAALLLLRPESIRLHAQAPAGHVPLMGTIHRAAYLGSMVEYDIEVASNQVTVVLFDPQESDLFPVGATVHLELLSENLYLLPAD